MLKVIVGVKRVIDYNVRVRVKSDGLGVDLDNVKMAMNPFDEVAVEEAIRLRERGLAEEVVVVSVGGSKSQDVLRMALALGVDRAILVECEGEVEPLQVAKILRGVCERESPRMVLLGKQAIDDDSNHTAQMLAGLWDCPQATFVSSMEVDGDGVRVGREVDGGIEKIWVGYPCVVSVDLRLNEPRYASLPNIMKAKKKPLEVISALDVGVSVENRLEVVRVEEPPERARGVRVGDVKELVSGLRASGILSED